MINQDNFYLNGYSKQLEEKECVKTGISEDEHQIFAVCDGMGGEECGEIAAKIAVQILHECNPEFFDVEWKSYIKKANQKICEYQRKYQKFMGSTFAGVYICSSKVIAINIGDSRIYRIREDKIIQLSEDHNEYQILVGAGIRISEHLKKMTKCRLTQFLGLPEEEYRLDPHVMMLDAAESGDRYLICSDGLSGTLSEEQIMDVIKEHEKKSVGIVDICEKLVRAAENQGNKDNITVLIMDIVDSCCNVQMEKIKKRIKELIKSIL